SALARLRRQPVLWLYANLVVGSRRVLRTFPRYELHASNVLFDRRHRLEKFVVHQDGHSGWLQSRIEWPRRSEIARHRHFLCAPEMGIRRPERQSPDRRAEDLLLRSHCRRQLGYRGLSRLRRSAAQIRQYGRLATGDDVEKG